MLGVESLANVLAAANLGIGESNYPNVAFRPNQNSLSTWRVRGKVACYK